MPEISEHGIFFDTKAGKVVESPPQEGVQIVAPGGEVTDFVKAEVGRWKVVESGVPQPVETVGVAPAPVAAPAEEPEPEAEPEHKSRRGAK